MFIFVDAVLEGLIQWCFSPEVIVSGGVVLDNIIFEKCIKSALMFVNGKDKKIIKTPLKII